MLMLTVVTLIVWFMLKLTIMTMLVVVDPSGLSVHNVFSLPFGVVLIRRLNSAAVQNNQKSRKSSSSL